MVNLRLLHASLSTFIVEKVENRLKARFGGVHHIGERPSLAVSEENLPGNDRFRHGRPQKGETVRRVQDEDACNAPTKIVPAKTFRGKVIFYGCRSSESISQPQCAADPVGATVTLGLFEKFPTEEPPKNLFRGSVLGRLSASHPVGVVPIRLAVLALRQVIGIGSCFRLQRTGRRRTNCQAMRTVVCRLGESARTLQAFWPVVEPHCGYQSQWAAEESAKKTLQSGLPWGRDSSGNQTAAQQGRASDKQGQMERAHHDRRRIGCPTTAPHPPVGGGQTDKQHSTKEPDISHRRIATSLGRHLAARSISLETPNCPQPPRTACQRHTP